VRYLLLLTFLWGQVSFIVEPIRYYTPEGQPYLELFLAVEGASVTPIRRPDSLYGGEVSFQVLIKNFAEEPIYADKFVVSLGPWPDTLIEHRHTLYIDARRLRLPSGFYTLEVTAQDKHQRPRPQTVQAITQLEIPAPLTGFGYSDLLLCRRITSASSGGYQRHGLSIEPLITGGVVVDPDTLAIFGEVYRIDSLLSGPYFLRFRVLDAQRAVPVEGFTFTRRPKKPTSFEAFVFTFPAHHLESGLYLLQVELCTNDGEVLASWYRRLTLISTREPLVDASETEYDTQYGFTEKKLDELLEGMTYLATPTEKSFLKTLSNYTDKKRFFVAFWKKRANKLGFPTFKEFLYRFEYAQQHFKSTLRPGYKTDRGRVFIQYGPPNDMQFWLNEPDKYPYIIWTYNQIGSQNNVFFVFYDPDLITGEFPLLHSNKIGELQNRNWRAFLLRARAASTGETEKYQRFGSGSAFLFRDDQTIGFTRDDR
jgi:GWxTD domain-containing protein